MIQSGRRKRNTETQTIPENGSLVPSARLTAILGMIVLAVFLVSAVPTESDPTADNEVYQVFADTDPQSEKPASAEKDTSLWAYLESIIARLIYGDL